MRRSITTAYFQAPRGRRSVGVLPVNAAALKYRYSAQDGLPACTSVGGAFCMTMVAIFMDIEDISEDSTFVIPLNNP